MRFIDGSLLQKTHRRGQRVFIIDHVRVLLDLNLRKVDRKGREHPQLQVEISRAAGGDQNAGDAVLALLDRKLLEIAELDLAGHIRAETIGHAVIPPGNGRIAALKLDVPGLSVRFRGDEAVHAVYGLAAARNCIALEFGGKQVALHDVLPDSFVGSPQGQETRAERFRFRRRVKQRRLLRSRVRPGRFLRFGRLHGSLAAAGKQQRGQENDRNQDFCALHRMFLLASVTRPRKNAANRL